jgi:hypothetical protein
MRLLKKKADLNLMIVLPKILVPKEYWMRDYGRLYKNDYLNRVHVRKFKTVNSFTTPTEDQSSYPIKLRI